MQINNSFLVLTFLLASCSGTTTGSMVGGIIGDQFGGGTANIAASAGGAAAGAYIAGKIDSAEPEEIKQAMQSNIYNTFAMYRTFH